MLSSSLHSEAHSFGLQLTAWVKLKTKAMCFTVQARHALVNIILNVFCNPSTG